MATHTDSGAPREALEVVRRDLRFDVDACDLRTWHPAGLHVTHFFNALSVFFPEGEKFFIESVRHYRDRIRSPQLAHEVAGFIGQEAMHGREHRRYNEALAEAGLPVDELETALKRFLSSVRADRSAEDALAATIALEHFTAILANGLLTDDRMLEGSDPRIAALWRWHAIEETEHKAVAYDVYEEVTRGDRLAFARRAGVMLHATVSFWTRVFWYHFRLVRADGAAGDLRGWWSLVRFLFVSPGSLRKLTGPWLAYFRPGFHPWQHDNSPLVARWKALYEANGRAPA
jgi:uncharacterized protein